MVAAEMRTAKFGGKEGTRLLAHSGKSMASILHLDFAGI